MIKKMLIANRGEIAVRIIRVCKELGISTVAVYSTIDKNSLHVELADESVCIGPAKASESYLNVSAIIQAASSTGCDAIHPGFGFLSENAGFARLVRQCGFIFVGPSPEIIEKMGNKIESKNLVFEAGVPVIPGGKEKIESIDEGFKKAEEIGYPVIVKASNAGGGKGIRIVKTKDEFENSFNSAKQEALSNFNSDEVYIEKFIENPKHVEVQVMGDKYGNVVHLFERDCSFQRNNQKMIEEAPCFILDDKTRKNMCNDAIKACKHVGYDSVGTIEFLLDSNGNYYFMEMNTRIQVEHPITEMVTGIDIVKYQIKIADNQKLNLKQKDIKLNGYALECRINAENPKFNFKPSPGKINFVNFPGGKGVRIESAAYTGGEISPFYDSMIAKIITFAPSRLECIKKMRIALEELIVDGIETNVEFHYLIMHHKKFIDGKYSTGFAREIIEELKENGEFI